MMARIFYTLALIVALPYVGLHLWLRSRRQPAYLRHVGERFGFYSQQPDGPLIWVHAVSVGETRAAEPLIKALAQRFPQHSIVMTHMTPTGRETSQAVFGESVQRVYLPYDYPWTVARFLSRFRPAIGIVMETEIWPNLVAACRARAIPLLLVNARLSEKSARRYARFARLTRASLQSLTAIAAQTEADASRLRALGAPRVQVVGNIKFDALPPAVQIEAGRALRQSIGTRPVLLAASTREGEEALILDALQRNPLNDTLLVIVPRHPQRFDEVAVLAAARGFKPQRRSANGMIDPATRVLLGDSMGEMFAYYTACDIAFIGGSLLPLGGQNLIEACAIGTPVLIGPHTFNFADAAEQAVAAGAARRVADAGELFATARLLLDDSAARIAMGEAGKAFAARHRGATQRTVDIVAQALGQGST